MTQEGCTAHVHSTIQATYKSIHDSLLAVRALKMGMGLLDRSITSAQFLVLVPVARVLTCASRLSTRSGSDVVQQHLCQLFDAACKTGPSVSLLDGLHDHWHVSENTERLETQRDGALLHCAGHLLYHF